MNYESLLSALVKSGLRFVIVGGVAMNLQGSALNTNDLDIVYARDPETIAGLIRTLSRFSPRLRTAGGRVSFRFDDRTIKHGMNFTLETSVGNIDLLGEIAGIGKYDGALKLSKPVKLGKNTVRVLSLAGLIKTKRASGRPKDKVALVELEALEELERETHA